MKLTIFIMKLAGFLGRSTISETMSLSRRPYRRVATLENLKRVLQLLHMIELHRFPFVESFEKSGVDEVSHCQAINREEFFLDHVAYLVSIKRAVAVLTPKVAARIDQHFCKLV